jgi:hypothetical protein
MRTLASAVIRPEGACLEICWRTAERRIGDVVGGGAVDEEIEQLLFGVAWRHEQRQRG